jgi:hypothetical protein
MTLSALGIFSAAGAGGAAFSSDYELIETYLLGTTQSSVVFSSLGTYSSTYEHLQIRVTARSNRADLDSPFGIQFNGNTSGYFWKEFQGTGSAVNLTGLTSQSSMRLGIATGATSTANNFGAAVIDILDPYSTTKNKTFRAFTGQTNLNRIKLNSGSLSSTGSLTSITVLDQFGSFVSGSRFSLYGLK